MTTHILFLDSRRSCEAPQHRSCVWADRASGIDRRSPSRSSMPFVCSGRKGEASQEQRSACPDAHSMDASPLPIIITAQSTFALAGLPTVRVVLTAGLHLTDGCHLKVSVVRAKHPKECTPHPHKPGYGCFAPTNNYYRPVHLCSRRSPDRASGINRRSPPHTLKSPGSFGRKGEASKRTHAASPQARVWMLRPYQ